MRFIFLYACFVLLVRAEAAHVVSVVSFTQPAGISSWDTWNFFSAGSFVVPEQWSETSVTWYFDGAVDAWYAGQASLGTASCYQSVPPVAGAMNATGTCAIQPSKTPYAVGVWLWGTSAALGGTWTITIEYAPAVSMPSLASPPPPPPPQIAAPPYLVPPAPPFGYAWTAQAGSGCVGSALSLVCDAGVAPSATELPTVQLATMAIPYSDPGSYYMGIFLLQAQEFSNLGFPAPIIATDATQTYNIWSADLPNTPSGESCQVRDQIAI